MKIPELKIPSREEMEAVAAKWYDSVGHSFYDNWPAQIRKLAKGTNLTWIDNKTIEDIINQQGKKYFEITKDIDAFISRLNGILDFRTPCFFKLNSRSGKDVWVDDIPPITVSGRQVVYEILNSVRLLEDLNMFRYLKEDKAYILLKPYTFPDLRNKEYRCFVKNRKIIGITYYPTKISSPPTVRNDFYIATEIKKWYEKNIRHHLHVSNIVIDVYTHHRPNGSINVSLIELNPYGLSDPIYFGSYKNIEGFHHDRVLFEPFDK